MVAAFHVDAATVAACTAVDVTILVGVLVFTSVFELVRGQDDARYSMDEREVQAHVRAVAAMVQGIVVLSSASGAAGLVAVALDNKIFNLAVLASAVLSVGVFALLAILTTRWFGSGRHNGART